MAIGFLAAATLLGVLPLSFSGSVARAVSIAERSVPVAFSGLSSALFGAATGARELPLLLLIRFDLPLCEFRTVSTPLMVATTLLMKVTLMLFAKMGFSAPLACMLATGFPYCAITSSRLIPL